MSAEAATASASMPAACEAARAEGGRHCSRDRPGAEVDALLADVAHEEFHGLGGPGTAVAGNTEAGRPDGVDIWVASATSTDTATVTWPMADGRWALVVMNADASPGVAVDMTMGARVDWLDELGIGLLVAGLLFVGAGVLTITLAARPRR
jgi:hypothetical protein